MSAVVKKSAKTAKKVSVDHPPYADMIKHAVKELKERNGSSRQAIVKYIRTNYKVDDKAESHIRRALVSGIKSGKLVHTKGAGASGSFKLAEKAAVKVAVVKASKTATKARTPKKTKVVKRPSTPKPASKATKSPKPKVMKPKKTPKKKTLKPKKPVVKKTPKKVMKK